MRKLLLLILLVIETTFLFAQISKNPEYMYCQLDGNPNCVAIDYGQYGRNPSDNIIMDEKTYKVKEFNSMIDAVNFMSKKGWEFVQTASHTATTSTMSSEIGISFSWILKRVRTDEDPTSYLPLTKYDLDLKNKKK